MTSDVPSASEPVETVHSETAPAALLDPVTPPESVPGDTIAVAGSIRWLKAKVLAARYGHIVLAIVGASLFVFTKPPVADLQAANARADAAARGVGPSYWLNWFAGSTPGGYSILMPTITAWLGVATAAASSVVVIAILARPVLIGARRQRSGAYLLVLCALCNLWSGRVAFALAAACSVAALVVLRHPFGDRTNIGPIPVRRIQPWLAGAVNALAALMSPLAPMFVLIGLSGPFIVRPEQRGKILRFAGVSLLGLLLPAVLFGTPGPMPYAAVTLCWTVGILLAAACLRVPRELRFSLLIGAAVAVGIFAFPNGVGANMGRYAFLAMPPLVWAVTEAPKRVIALGLIPAMFYSGYQVIGDVHRASAPEAKPEYFTALRDELATLPHLHEYRVEVIDTSTHLGDNYLVPTAYLARGWENQSDTEANPIFYTGQPLNADVYRRWLDSAAVAWIAVPSHPLERTDEEAALVKGGLPYLKQIWADKGGRWTLYAVKDPQPIVSPPNRLVRADETTMRIEVPQSGHITVRIRLLKYLTLTKVDDPATKICLLPDGDTAIDAVVPSPGTYDLQGKFDLTKVLGSSDCPSRP